MPNLWRNVRTVGGTTAIRVITTHPHVALQPEAITQSEDSRMICVWLPAMRTCQLPYLYEQKSAVFYITMPGYHNHGCGKDVLPIQPWWWPLKTTGDSSSSFSYQKWICLRLGIMVMVDRERYEFGQTPAQSPKQQSWSLSAFCIVQR